MAVVHKDLYPVLRTEHHDADDTDCGAVLKQKERCTTCKGKLEYPFVHYVGFGDRHAFFCHDCCDLMLTRGFQKDLEEIKTRRRQHDEP